MRSKLWITWAAIRGVLLILVISTAVKAPARHLPEAPTKPMGSWDTVSSWYGPGFHGRTTANGEVFDMYAPTAAHTTLPLGTLVRLVNPRNGKARVVRINDRGPFIDGRELDVSYEVAQSLGFVEKGVTLLQIEVLEVPKRSARKAQPVDRSAGL
jgi:rare lipoprotein A